MARLNKYAKKQREKLGISQKSLAKSLGYGSAQLISNFEREIQSMPLKKVPKLCKRLQIPQPTAKKLLIEDYSEKIQRVWK